MARIQVGGDPEQYMDAPTLAVGGGGGDKDGISPIAAIFEFLGIHRNVARSPKAKKETVKTQGMIKPTANDFLDVTGSELAKQDLANYRPLTEVDLPPSNFIK